MSKTRVTDRVGYDGDYVYVEVAVPIGDDHPAFAEELGRELDAGKLEAIEAHDRLTRPSWQHDDRRQAT